jgi:hypothetical protein
MNKIISILSIYTGFLVAMPFAANALDMQAGKNTLPVQTRPPYAIGYTVHYRNPRDKKWLLEGFHLERRDAERAASKLLRLGYRTDIRSRAEAERRNG